MSARNIKVERENRGWTLEEVAEKVGITKQSISAIENGEVYPSYKTLCKLENLFDRSHKYLFGAATPNNTKEPDGNQAEWV